MGRKMAKSLWDMVQSDLRELPDTARGRGIYFLWAGDELLYIGASLNATDRIQRQSQIRDFGARYESTWYKKTPIIPFDKATIWKWEGLIIDMADAERALIKRFRPPYNEPNERHGEIRWARYIEAEAREMRERVTVSEKLTHE